MAGEAREQGERALGVLGTRIVAVLVGNGFTDRVGTGLRVGVVNGGNRAGGGFVDGVSNGDVYRAETCSAGGFDQFWHGQYFVLIVGRRAYGNGELG